MKAISSCHEYQHGGLEDWRAWNNNIFQHPVAIEVTPVYFYRP
jgi:hypothetical protein